MASLESLDECGRVDGGPATCVHQEGARRKQRKTVCVHKSGSLSAQGQQVDQDVG